MALANLINTKDFSKKRVLLVLCFVILFFVTRVPRLQNDIINPDGVNWHYRSQMFMNGLKYHNLVLTYQHYHPGVTLMWITAPPIELFRHIPGNDKYDMYNFIGFDFIAKFALINAQLLITILLIFFLSKILGFYESLGVITLLSLEPFFLGNSRLFHLDILLTLLMFLSITTFYLSVKFESKLFYLLTGIFLGLSFLTKTVSITLVFFLLLVLAGKGLFTKSIKKNVLYASILFFAFCVTVFVLFPALWVRPVYFILNLFTEGYRVGVKNGHEVVVLGDTQEEGGLLFYPLALLVKISPLLLFGFAGYVTLFFKNIKKDMFSLIVLGFYLFYFLVMCVPSKKLDRYMLVLFPMFALYTALFFKSIFIKYQKRIRIVASIFVLGAFIFIVYPLIKLFPYYFTYSSPLVGSAENANKLIGQKPFGVGMYDLKEFILDKYGYYPKLGFIDVKPMESIYPNRLVFDLRTFAVEDYDLAILGPNEEFSNRVKRSPYKLVKDSSIYINGLEYWRIYVKEHK